MFWLAGRALELRSLSYPEPKRLTISVAKCFALISDARLDVTLSFVTLLSARIVVDLEELRGSPSHLSPL